MPADRSMQPLAHWPVADRQIVRGVLTDVDDTLTADGAIQPRALNALAALAHAGLPVVAITGRPVGWSLPFVQGPQAWPVSAIVAENGAVALLPRADGTVERRYSEPDADVRARQKAHLDHVARQVLAQVPGTALARDSAGRECDIAIDHSEFATLSDAQVAAVVTLMRAQGLNATVSSIHINGWLGEHDKLSGARWMLSDLFGADLDAEARQWVFVGDSTNDERLFAHLPQSVGVANIRRFENRLQHRPRYVTQAERGDGFAEVAAALLQARA